MITLITPTGDRKISFNLTIKYMIQQQILADMPVQWIVVDDGLTPETQEVLQLNNGYLSAFHFKYIRRDPNIEKETGKNSPRSLAANLLTAIPYVKGDFIFVIEDDDWYSPLYLHDGVTKLEENHIAGSIWQCYYNLEQLTFKVMKNKGSSLCSTCFRMDLLPLFKKVCITCYDANFKGIDYSFWLVAKQSGVNYFIDEAHNYLCVGMKSLPGRKGIGIGHEGRRFYPDPTAKKLREWVGEESCKKYLGIRNEMLRNRPRFA